MSGMFERLVVGSLDGSVTMNLEYCVWMKLRVSQGLEMHAWRTSSHLFNFLFIGSSQTSSCK